MFEIINNTTTKNCVEQKFITNVCNKKRDFFFNIEKCMSLLQCISKQENKLDFPFFWIEIRKIIDLMVKNNPKWKVYGNSYITRYFLAVGWMKCDLLGHWPVEKKGDWSGFWDEYTRFFDCS